MTRALIVGWMAAALCHPLVVSAQPPGAKPVIEVGTGLTVADRDTGTWTSLGPRLSLNLRPRTALDVAADWEPRRGGPAHRDAVSVQIRQAVHLLQRGEIFVTAGLVRESVTFTEAWTGPSPRFGSRRTNTGVQFGVGAQVELARRLAVRGDVQFVMHDDAFVQSTVGVTVPIGRYPDRAAWAADRAAAGGPLESLRPGQHVWVTTADGTTLEGDVTSRSGSVLTLRRGPTTSRVAAADIRRLDTTDRIRDGLLTGAGVGAASGAVFGILLGAALCESGGHCALEGGLIVGAVGGAAGAVAGALIDSLRVGRRPVYAAHGAPERPVFVLAPVVVRQGAGAAGLVRW